MRFTLPFVLIVLSSCTPGPASTSADDLDSLFEDGVMGDPASQENAVLDADPAGRIDVWERAVLDRADDAMVERIKADTEALLLRLEADLEEERGRSPYSSVDERQRLLRRISYESERMNRIEARLGR